MLRYTTIAVRVGAVALGALASTAAPVGASVRPDGDAASANAITAQAPSGCHILASAQTDSVKAVDGRWRDGTGRLAGETTEFLRGGAYRVTRCTATGSLAVSQINAPVTVPGGTLAVLTVTEIRPAPFERNGQRLYEARSGLYASPRDPAWTRTWNRVGPQMLAAVIPPTAS